MVDWLGALPFSLGLLTFIQGGKIVFSQKTHRKISHSKQLLLRKCHSRKKGKNMVFCQKLRQMADTAGYLCIKINNGPFLAWRRGDPKGLTSGLKKKYQINIKKTLISLEVLPSDHLVSTPPPIGSTQSGISINWR